jgi:hypothetical protein
MKIRNAGPFVGVALLAMSCSVRSAEDTSGSNDGGEIARDAGTLDAGGSDGGVVDNGILELSPNALDFRSACLDATDEMPVVLRNSGTGVLHIVSITESDSAFSIRGAVPTKLDPQTSATLSVAFTPTEAKTYSAFLRVTTSPADAVQAVTLVGNGFNGQPNDFEVSCQCASSSGGLSCGDPTRGMKVQPCHFLAFPAASVGQTTGATVTLRNLGCRSLQVSQAAFSDDVDDAQSAALYTGWFSTDLVVPITLRGGESRDVRVSFAPTMTAQPNVRLTFLSNDSSALRPGQTTAGAWDLGLFAESVR